MQKEAMISTPAPVEGKANIEKLRSHRERISTVETHLAQIEESLVPLFSLENHLTSLELN